MGSVISLYICTSQMKGFIDMSAYLLADRMYRDAQLLDDLLYRELLDE